MRAIVHIGTEKTGTSSIQLFLHANRKKLVSSGYHYLQSAGKTNNWALPAYCSEEERFDDLFRIEKVYTAQEKETFKLHFIDKFERELRSVKKNVHTVIISSEHFHSRLRTQDEIGKVHKFLSGYFDDVKVVCYLREQADTCASWYSTSVKSGGTFSFGEFLLRCRPENYYFNYNKVLANWEYYFGIDALDVALFDKDSFLNGDLLDDFIARVDPGLLGNLNKRVETENESLAPVGQALMRAINIAFPVTIDRGEIFELKDKCKKFIGQALRGRGQQPDLAARQDIYESFIESNELLRQRFFPASTVLFPAPVDLQLEEEPVGEEFFEVLSGLFSVLSTEGSGLITPETVIAIWSSISSNLNNVLKERNSEPVAGTEMFLGEKEARLFRQSARRIEWKDPKSALRLMSLAKEISPFLPGINNQMEQCRLRSDTDSKPEYLITYHKGKSKVGENETSGSLGQFQTWSNELDRPFGSPVIFLSCAGTIDSRKEFTTKDQPSVVGHIVYRADSLESAISIASDCPLLDFGGSIEVFTIKES